VQILSISLYQVNRMNYVVRGAQHQMDVNSQTLHCMVVSLSSEIYLYLMISDVSLHCLNCFRLYVAIGWICISQKIEAGSRYETTCQLKGLEEPQQRAVQRETCKRDDCDRDSHGKTRKSGKSRRKWDKVAAYWNPLWSKRRGSGTAAQQTLSDIRAIPSI